MAKFTRADSTVERAYEGIAPRPNQPIATTDLAFERFREGERFAGGDVPLSKLGGGGRVGVHLVELAPGKQSCPFHYHLLEEEHAYVLEGRCVARVGDARHPMGPGDYICFPPSTGVGHCFENPHPEPCRLLMIGEKNPDEIAVYPDSGKAKLRRLGTIVDLPDEPIDYWRGEKTDEPLE